jgi:hypothetical protein
VEAVLDLYGRYRLLTFDRDPLTREPTVEVAHEALIRAWDRLRSWLDASRDDLRVQRRLAADVAEWARAGRSMGFLAGRARLAQYATLAEAERDRTIAFHMSRAPTGARSCGWHPSSPRPGPAGTAASRS